MDWIESIGVVEWISSSANFYSVLFAAEFAILLLWLALFVHYRRRQASDAQKLRPDNKRRDEEGIIKDTAGQPEAGTLEALEAAAPKIAPPAAMTPASDEIPLDDMAGIPGPPGPKGVDGASKLKLENALKARKQQMIVLMGYKDTVNGFLGRFNNVWEFNKRIIDVQKPKAEKSKSLAGIISDFETNNDVLGECIKILEKENEELDKKVGKFDAGL
jgi:hypothetical protein